MAKRKILSLIFNITAIVFTIVGLLLTPNLSLLAFVKYFTLVTNSLILFSATITIGFIVDSTVKKNVNYSLPTAIYALRLTTAVCAFITFFTVVTYLQYQPGMNTAWNLFLHYFAPLTFVAGFLVSDIDRKYSIFNHFFGLTIIVVYALYAIPLSNIAGGLWGEPPYPFLNLGVVKWWALIILPLFIFGAHLVSFLLWLFNRIIFLIFVGVEIKAGEALTREERRVEEKVKVTPEDEKAVAELMKKGYTGPRVYHISKRDDKLWQVKFANGKKAIKLFRTQAEAIVFAKKLAKSQDGSIRIHSIKGRIRKGH